MKRNLAFAGMAAAMLMIVGQVGAAQANTIIYNEGPVYQTTSPPPPERRENIPPPPRVTMVWVSGHWIWYKDAWHWKKGHYVERPAPEAVWVPSHWVHRVWGWTLVPGHWL